MFSIDDALNAYRSSLYAAAVHDTNARIGERSIPIVGGLWSRVKQVGNAVVRIPYVAGSFVVGHGEVEPPAMPEVPEAFAGTDLETAYTDAWRLKGQNIEARVESIRSITQFDIQGYQQNISVARHAKQKETNVTFPEERTPRSESSALGTALRLGGLTAGAVALQNDGVGREIAERVLGDLVPNIGAQGGLELAPVQARQS